MLFISGSHVLKESSRRKLTANLVGSPNCFFIYFLFFCFLPTCNTNLRIILFQWITPSNLHWLEPVRHARLCNVSIIVIYL